MCMCLCMCMFMCMCMCRFRCMCMNMCIVNHFWQGTAEAFIIIVIDAYMHCHIPSLPSSWASPSSWTSSSLSSHQVVFVKHEVGAGVGRVPMSGACTEHWLEDHTCGDVQIELFTRVHCSNLSRCNIYQGGEMINTEIQIPSIHYLVNGRFVNNNLTERGE